MLISFIIPTFNNENTIAICIESILSLQESDISFEILIIDDGSTDNTRIIVQQFVRANRNVKYIYQVNQGPSAARNLGLELSKGKYIFFVDGDDFVNVEPILKNIQLISAKYQTYFFPLLKLDFKSGKKELLDPSIRKFNGLVNLCDLFSQSKFIGSSCGILFPSKIIKNNKIVFTRNMHCEDIKFNYEYFKKSKEIYIINDPIYTYVQWSNSRTSKTNANSIVKSLLFIFSEFDLDENLDLYILAYELPIAIGYYFFAKNNISKKEIVHYIPYLKKVKTMRAKIIYLLYKIFGFKILSFLLSRKVR